MEYNLDNFKKGLFCVYLNDVSHDKREWLYNLVTPLGLHNINCHYWVGENEEFSLKCGKGEFVPFINVAEFYPMVVKELIAKADKEHMKPKDTKPILPNLDWDKLKEELKDYLYLERVSPINVTERLSDDIVNWFKNKLQ